MHILITGGSGLIGRQLIGQLAQRNYRISVVTRHQQKTRRILRPYISTLNQQPELWPDLSDKSLNGIDAVINLAGESIARRWSAATKQRLCQSRWQITEQLAQMINNSHSPPPVFISGSAVGYYGDLAEQQIDEDTPPHDEFTHTLCHQWEQLALLAGQHSRVCLLRTGIVLSARGGMLARLLPLFRAGLGGHTGQGTQYLSWIHIDDLVRGILWLLDHPLSGPFNMVAANPVTSAAFSHSLARVLQRPVLLHYPAWLMRCLLGESAALLLASQRAYPKRLLESGFQFRWPQCADALRAALNPDSD